MQANDTCLSSPANLMIWLFADVGTAGDGNAPGSQPIELQPRIGPRRDPTRLIECDPAELGLSLPPRETTLVEGDLAPPCQPAEAGYWRGLGATMAWGSSLLLLALVLGLVL